MAEAASQEEEPKVPVQYSRYIAGVKVHLPVKPYPSQLAMMQHIISGLKKRQNCLLESPTGSGKSLALLCSTLAWQRMQIDRAERYNAMLDEGITDPDVLARAAGISLESTQPTQDDITPTPAPTPNLQEAASGSGFFYGDDDDDFVSQSPSQIRNVMERNNESFVDTEDVIRGDNTPKKLKVPKIFLGTRTHKQVTQLVSELRRTAYRDVNMVVLSSRDHSCIHPEVSTSFNKIAKCQELLDLGRKHHTEPGCPYNSGVRQVKTHDLLFTNGGLEGAWDIEDLVRVGRKIKACPYYTARSLLANAELVVCPYNYLLDPQIRKSMDISLANHVVVLDEAHNIEDAAMSAASCTITQENMDEAVKAILKVSEEEAYVTVAHVLVSLSQWIDEKKDSLTDYTDYEKSSKIFSGTEIIAVFEHLGFGRDKLADLKRSMTKIEDNEAEADEEQRLGSAAKMVLDSLFLMLTFLYMDNMKHKDDYRVAVVKEQVWKKPNQSLSGWINKKNSLVMEYSMNFWCLNPAVAFGTLSSVTHSIILTSGTLAPLDSFQSELGVSFKYRLEANHVIDPSQVFVGTIAEGPTKKSLVATYQYTSTLDFQDELGGVVLQVCRTVPGGVLCFLPSYTLLNKLHERWQNTGIWDEICQVKEAMTEKKRGEDFEKDMEHFYYTIKNAQIEEPGSLGGVFLMAVFRGKVSEGIDFSDDNARVVISVGIPFPNMKNILVDLKKKYNDKFQLSRKLLSGNEWYNIQAYRAINQALGRCIRHRQDWGALLMVDQRFQAARKMNYQTLDHYNTAKLSKWVRNKIVHHRQFSDVMRNLKGFVDNMVKNPPQPLASSSASQQDHLPPPEKKMKAQDAMWA